MKRKQRVPEWILGNFGRALGDKADKAAEAMVTLKVPEHPNVAALAAWNVKYNAWLKDNPCPEIPNSFYHRRNRMYSQYIEEAKLKIDSLVSRAKASEFSVAEMQKLVEEF